ncbi:MAG: hypothetical protein PHU49_16725 [Syntrophorhabdaceae bacterium]|nr:hypothetical protein [Syntrophorhabdaceae bacterium]
MTVERLTKLTGRSYGTLHYWLRKQGTAFRDPWKSNSVELSSEAVEFIDGELLGDGSLFSHSGRSASFSHTSMHYPYSHFVMEILSGYGLELSGGIYERSGDRSFFPRYPDSKGHPAYSIQTRSYLELLPLRRRWYPNEKKIAPADLTLTPLICRQWYLGDGHLYRGRGGLHISLCTQGFADRHITRLVNKLNEIGFCATMQSNRTIRIWKRSIVGFIDFIGPCPPEIEGVLGYKWALPEDRYPRTFRKTPMEIAIEAGGE